MQPEQQETATSVEDRVALLLSNTKPDIISWTSLLVEVEETSPDDIGRLSLVYDSFLSQFPFCYGYWKKYAYHMVCLCTAEKGVEVYERAVQAATYSVDLWADYCSFAVRFYEDPDDVRRLYERGLSFVGKDYLCHIIWDKYIEFEYSHKHWGNLAHIYIRTLRFPSKRLHHYYESFKKLVAIWEEELKWQNNGSVLSEVALTCEPTELKPYRDSEISKLIGDLIDQPLDLHKSNVFEKYLSAGENLYKISSQLDKNISFYETAIHRRYFHAKPLDEHQLENWHRYLDFVEMQGDFDWTVKLYERCLIPCANYQEFWIRYAEHTETKGGREMAKHALERASKTFLKGDGCFHFYCARFKERIGDTVGAKASFRPHESVLSPNFIENVNREANMERRLRNIEAAFLIYEEAILMAEEKQNLQILSLLYIHFAQFNFVVTGCIDTAREIFVRGILKVPQSKSLLEGLIQFMIMHGGKHQISSVDSIVGNAIAPKSGVSQILSLIDQVEISYLLIEFVDLYGTICEIEKAWDRHRKLFPHLLRPVSNITEKATSEMAKHEQNGRMYPRHHPHEGNDAHSLDKHLLSVEKNISPLSDGAAANKSESECPGMKGELVQTMLSDDTKNKSTEEATELPAEFSDPSHEGNVVSQSLNVPTEDFKIINQVQGKTCFDSLDGTRPPALESLSLSSPIEETQNSELMTITTDDAPLLVTSMCTESVNHDEGNIEMSDFPNSNKMQMQSYMPMDATKSSDYPEFIQVHMQPNMPVGDPKAGSPESNQVCKQSNCAAQANPQTDFHHLCTSTNSNPVQPQTSLPSDQGHLQKDKEKHVHDRHLHSSSSGINSSQIYYGGQTSVTSVSAHTPQFQQHPDSAQLQHPHGANSNMLSQGFPSQQQIWQGQVQQHSQEQSQYVTTNGQVYQAGTLVCRTQNLQQQGFPSAYQPQANTQMDLQSQAQLYQHAAQGYEQYAYAQNAQGYSPQLWYYYQQQLYHMQLQHQSLQLQYQQANIEQSHQLQQKSPQLQQQHDQEQLNLPQKQQQPQQHLQQRQQDQQIQQNHQKQQLQKHPQDLSQPQLQIHQNQFHMQQQEQLQQQLSQQMPHHHLQQLQQQHLLLQQQQQLLQQQQQQLFVQQKQQEQLLQQQHQHHPITPSEIQALSNKYLQGQGVVSQNIENPGPDCPSSSQQRTSSE